MKKRGIIKFLALIVILSLSMTVLVGCGQETDKKTESNEEVEGKDAEAKEESATQDVIKVATSGTYYPYTYMEDDELVGFDIDIWEEIGKRLGKEIQWEITSFDGMFGMLDTGKVDAAAHQISITPEREKKYIFSEIYAYNPYKLYVREDEDEIETLEDLKNGKKFICGATGYEKEFIEAYDVDDEIEKIIADGLYAKEIELGRADAALHPVVNFDIRMREGGYKVKMVGDVLYEEKNAYPFNKNVDKNLLEEINQAIKDMHEDGTLSKLSEERFDMDITKSDM